jgi:hypothetical protein
MKTPNFKPVDFYPNAKYYDYYLNALSVIETKLATDEFPEANEIINRIKNMGR